MVSNFFTNSSTHRYSTIDMCAYDHIWRKIEGAGYLNVSDFQGLCRAHRVTISWVDIRTSAPKVILSGLKTQFLIKLISGVASYKTFGHAPRKFWKKIT